jgi:hypothetical protein
LHNGWTRKWGKSHHHPLRRPPRNTTTVILQSLYASWRLISCICDALAFSIHIVLRSVLRLRNSILCFFCGLLQYSCIAGRVVHSLVGVHFTCSISPSASNPSFCKFSLEMWWVSYALGTIRTSFGIFQSLICGISSPWLFPYPWQQKKRVVLPNALV